MFNILSLALSTIVFVVAGSLLYNPMHAWGRKWATWSRIELKDGNPASHMTRSDMIFTFGGTVIAGLFLSISISHVTYWIHQLVHHPWFVVSLEMATVLWLGVYAVGQFVVTAFNSNGNPHYKKLVGLHLVNGLIEMLLMAVVIGLFPLN